jgi:hypothetical protein
MNTQVCSHHKSANLLIGSLLVLLAALFLAACSSVSQAFKPACNVDLDRLVSISVSNVNPRAFFNQLAGDSSCSISVSPLVFKHVTLYLHNASIGDVVSIACQQIGCQYIYNYQHLSIRPFSILDRLQAWGWNNLDKWMEAENKALDSTLPQGMRFANVSLDTVLKEISKAAGFTFKPWKGEGGMKVSVDVSGMNTREALITVVLAANGTGAVLVKSPGLFATSYAQLWLVGSP